MAKLDIDNLKNLTSSLSSLKSKIDKLQICKLETTPVDWSKLSDVVENYVVKKTEYVELVEKVNNIKTIDTSDLVDCDTKISEIEKRILDHYHDEYITTQTYYYSRI